jgi:hypothetical protein
MEELIAAAATRRSRIWNRICSRLYTGGNSRTSITIRSWSSPHLEDVEMTDIPGAAYKATCRVASTANITTLSGLLTIDGTCCERQSVS